MRTEKEILDLILNTANEDDRIRAVILNGSRANPNALKDIFQDYDIVYLVTDVMPFRRNYDWIKRFGELMILQTPEDMEDPQPAGDGNYTYLMQFADGNRIDLSIRHVTQVNKVTKDSQSISLLDKDGIVETLPLPSDADYLPRPPSEKQFADCCNEFWWVCPYVAKGLWRDELVYAKHMLDNVVREKLVKMLEWHIGIKTGFSKNPGKMGKYFKNYLEPEMWQQLTRTYSGSDFEDIWRSLFNICTLFRTVSTQVAGHFDYKYPSEDDKKVTAHLYHVKALSKKAKTIY
ncbi:aminoglycoside 6-adenylyltransferase [candidate division TA06 bacterium]|nr:aminoglycoside 6-adenylyltransferase [candidate division TA06 bacterium]